ncbi:MAG: hypothetical protein ACR2NM_15105 [Bythopirellula sp.]
MAITRDRPQICYYCLTYPGHAVEEKIGLSGSEHFGVMPPSRNLDNLKACHNLEPANLLLLSAASFAFSLFTAQAAYSSDLSRLFF